VLEGGGDGRSGRGLEGWSESVKKRIRESGRVCMCIFVPVCVWLFVFAYESAYPGSSRSDGFGIEQCLLAVFLCFHTKSGVSLWKFVSMITVAPLC